MSQENPKLRKMAASLKDVASLAQAAPASVSVVLNGSRSSAGVSPAARERILWAADQLKYRPNAVARSLIKRRTDIIGFYGGYGFLSARDQFLAQIIGGMQEGCDNHRKDLLLHGTFRGRTANDIYRELASRKLDGVVLWSPPREELLARLVEADLPVVLVADPVEGAPVVTVDDAGGSRQLAEHLANKGHRRVLYRKNRLSAVSAVRRYDAFCKVAKERGMTVIDGFALDDWGTISRQEQEILALPDGERPTAAACWVDHSADNLIQYCMKTGLRVPEDLAVVGFNGIDVSVWPAYCLTTIRAPWYEVSSTAVDLLVKIMDGEEVPAETVLNVSLRVGDTT